MFKRIIIASALILGFFAVSAAAQQTDNPRRNGDQNRQERRGNGQRKNGKFDQLDLDRDGFISRNEWEAGSTRQGREKAFDRIDTNGDGRISRDEFDLFRQRKGGGKNSQFQNTETR